MLSTKKINENIWDKASVISTVEYGGVRFEVLQLEKLQGAVSANTAMGLFFMENSNIKARMIRAVLNDGEINMEAGAFYYSTGNIQSSTIMGGVGGTVKGIFRGAVTGESTFRPSYSGSGEIFLEPSVKHYIFMELNNESVIVDKNMYYCSTGNITLTAEAQKNLSSAIAGGEGVFQIKLSGSGIVVLESLIPECEISPVYIRAGESLKVDGSFAIARTEGITFSTGRSDKSLAKSLINGEGLLQTFTGHGIVWLAPTEPFYTRLSTGEIYKNKGSHNK